MGENISVRTHTLVYYNNTDIMVLHDDESEFNLLFVPLAVTFLSATCLLARLIGALLTQ